jgi:UDPglucose--hexose-1-phosphate uridylyltransferase
MAERRFNPLTREWVLVSPHRTDRPWLGERSPAPASPALPYDPTCFLCPGNQRANGARNPRYEATYVFENDYPALTHESRLPFKGVCPQQSLAAHSGRYAQDEPFVSEEVQGECRVVCFSPRHDLHLGVMEPRAIEGVVDCWAAQYEELAAKPLVSAVTIFENRGAMMGASNPHPHGQIWAESSIPNELAKETESFFGYRRAREACLLCTYANLERERGERIVYADDRTLAVVPYWATWPFELLVVGAHCGSLAAYDAGGRASLAAAMRDLVSRYDRLFGIPFPSSMGFHQQPTDGAGHDEWHAHAHYYPPLLRSASVRKYMVGYEMLAQPQRDLTAEHAAQALRDA